MKNFVHESVDQFVCGTVWTSPLCKKLMEELSYDIGPRPVASKAMQEGQKLLAGEFRKLGAKNVHSEPVPVLAWQEAPSVLELLAPRKRTYDSMHCVHSAAGSCSGPLLDAGRGSPQELDRLGRRVKGSVLLIRGHTISGAKYVPLPQQVQEISERGAAGILFRSMYHVGGSPAIELAGVSKAATIPVLGISCETGHELAALSQAGKPKIRIDVAGKSVPARCSNLVAELGPSQSSQEWVILSAHFDTFYVNPGSLDNLTGVISLMEIVQALSPFQSKFKRRLRILIYTGEEYGFIGSKSYVQRHADELENLSFVFNLDTLFPATAEGVAVMEAPLMRDYIDGAFQQTPHRVDVRDMFCMSSDYLPFMLQGIATARPADWRNSMPIWSHTRMDTPDKINLDWLRSNAMVFARLLARILMDPRPLPVTRKSPEEVKARLDSEKITASLQGFGFDV